MKQMAFPTWVALLLGLACLGSAKARADVTYTYTGNPFTYAEYPFTTSQSVTGSFVLSQPLADSLSFATITPLSFIFIDGEQSIASTNAYQGTFSVSTDSAGVIDAWNISLASQPSSVVPEIVTAYYGPGDLGNSDMGFYPTGIGYAYVRDAPGTWAVSSVISSVPEPSALWILGSGLLGLAFLCRGRKTLRGCPGPC